MSETVAGARYVVGFMFDETETRVLLIRKKRPAWQAGKLNGVGGRIEDGETPAEAMRREFVEEVGIDCESWKYFCTLSDEREWQIDFFFAVGNVWDAQVLTDERPEVAIIGALPSTVIPNLRWLIPMALTMKHERVASFEIKEAA
jgi:8-oxo-dGTP diphosphatase